MEGVGRALVLWAYCVASFTLAPRELAKILAGPAEGNLGKSGFAQRTGILNFRPSQYTAEAIRVFTAIQQSLLMNPVPAYPTVRYSPHKPSFHAF